MPFSFSSFDGMCQAAALVVCPLLGPGNGYVPTCYSRNVEFGSTIIFQPAVSFMHIVALIMVAIMVFHVRTKYTAVGRKEILHFFYLYALVELIALFLDSGIIPSSSTVYPWFTGIFVGLVCATYWCLLVNGFVGFQFAEDGTPMSLWFLRLSCLTIFGLCFFIAICTFKSVAGFSPTKTLGLWVIYYIFNGICVVVYVVLQLVLVLRTLDDRWPIGDIIFGTAFFTISQVIIYGFSDTICDAVKHYLDGLFFSTLLILFSVMMVYKYWDSITKEDLEFSVGSKAAAWEVNEGLLHGYEDDDVPYKGSLLHGAGGHGTYAGMGYPPNKY